jgi:4-amino-4-deoxy-L-arabinose transferase-like glycosyltransferase
LPFHDGARIATALFGAAFLYLIYRTAAVLNGRDAGFVAPVLAIGTVGLIVPIHDAQPAIAVLTATALAFLGLALIPQQTLRGGLWLGLGCGAAVLFGGLSAAVPLWPLLLAPVLRRQWPAFLLAMLVALSVAAIWPALLAWRVPDTLQSWWLNEIGMITAHRATIDRSHLELLAWFSWPLLPFAVWALWINRGNWRNWNLLIPLAGSLLALAWYFTGEARPLGALPLLPPLVLLSCAGVHRLRRGAANAFDWFGMMTFTLTIGLIWLGGIAMWTGQPTQIAHNFAKLAPGFVAQFSLSAFAVACVFTAGWIAALFKLPRSPWRAAIRWTVGIVAMWGVLAALWFPWIDYGKSYRPVAESLARALPKEHGCIEDRNLGPAQRAALDYHAGIRTVPQSRRAACRWLLTQGPAQHEATPAGWERIWEGHRPGDRGERLRLYRRSEG